MNEEETVTITGASAMILMYVIHPNHVDIFSRWDVPLEGRTVCLVATGTRSQPAFTQWSSLETLFGSLARSD